MLYWINIMLVGILWLWPTVSTRHYRFSWEGRPSRRPTMPFRMMSNHNVEHVLEREGLWFLLELVLMGVLFLICGRWPWVSGEARCVPWEIAVAFRPNVSTRCRKVKLAAGYVLLLGKSFITSDLVYFYATSPLLVHSWDVFQLTANISNALLRFKYTYVL